MLSLKIQGFKPGDRVIVLGPGTIGILCAAVAKLCGADVAVVGLETDIHRLNIAKQYGCDVIAGDASAWAKQRDGLGADCVIDAAGTNITLKNRAGTRSPTGHITKVGWGLSRWASPRSLVQKNVTLQG